jgi:hypothetical protein
MQSTTSDSIRDLAKSLLSISGAASSFGVSQFGRLLDVRSPLASINEAARRFDSVTRAVTDQIDPRFSSAFARTDVIQRGVVDLMADFITLNPSGLLGFSGFILEPVASALDPLVAAVDRAFPGAEAEVRWLELRNKMEIYLLVANAEARLQISPVERTPLSELVERAYALDAFPALWAVEGLGHYYGEQALRGGPAPRGLLTGPEATAVRSGALVMLHPGIGLAFAQSLLGPVKPDNAASALPSVLRDFVALCRDNSQPGYIGGAYESLGLVARTFHRDLIADIDRELRQSAGELVGYFWHGVGRALYFAPGNFLPCTDIDWAGAPEAAPHEIGRLNITAGLAWAVTLVNMRQPAIMERLLRYVGDVVARTPGFANGVSSSILMRYDTTPEAPFLDDFLSYQPGPDAPMTVQLWEREVRGPAVEALRHWYGPLKRAGRLGEVYRFPPPVGPNQREVPELFRFLPSRDGMISRERPPPPDRADDPTRPFEGGRSGSKPVPSERQGSGPGPI